MCHIRQGNETDCEAVLTVLQAAFGVYQNLAPPSGVTGETVAALRGKMAQETLWVAEISDGSETTSRHIVACVFTKPHQQYTNALYFGRLAVLPAYQRQGIARRLIAVVEQQAREQGFRQVVLGVRVALSDNVRYYQSLGYEIIGSGTHPGYAEPTYYRMGRVIG
ncbi:MAG TPA: GNAT family N-acetyltransferase [Chloroflexota bacterium]|nr:GNAT family N-acetyltransferase [Chloroflexota bacterium]HUM69920.1 GNAT family N-acetyltransferase [Chloroflexota bacterium]